MIENSISPGMVKWLFFGMLLFSGEAFAQVKDSMGSFQAPDSVTSRHHWIKPVAIGMGYAVSNYLCYRYLDTRIQRFSQRSKINSKQVFSVLFPTWDWEEHSS